MFTDKVLFTHHFRKSFLGFRRNQSKLCDPDQSPEFCPDYCLKLQQDIEYIIVTRTRGMEFLDVVSFFLSALSAFTVYWYYYSPGRKRGMKRHWEEMYVDDDMALSSYCKFLWLS